MEGSIIAEALLAGTVQGITELLPVSSSGHLLLLSILADIDLTLLGIAVLHLGTLGSLIVVMRDKIPQAFKMPLSRNILVGIIPAGFVGFLFLDLIDTYLGHSSIIIASLIIWGIALIVADQYARKKSLEDTTVVELEKISPMQSLIIGLVQILAFIPGTSRSGITTIGGIATGLSRSTALSFSFLMGIPLLAISGLYALMKLLTDTPTQTEVAAIVVGTLAAFVVGTLVAIVFRKFIEKSILTICGVYRVVLGVVLALAFTLQ